MRFKPLIASALLVLLAAPVFAQEDYTEFADKANQFTITFPGKPVKSEGTWVTEYGVILPSTIYTVDGFTGHHTLTVVDYTPVERVLQEKADAFCPLGAETCQGVGDTGLGYWKNDIRGAVTYAMSKGLVGRDVKVTHLMFNFMVMVGGQEMQVINNKDGSRTSTAAYMHANRLIVAESTTPKGMPPALTLQQSFGFTDPDGKAVRYRYLYLNEPDHGVPPPPVGRQGAAAPAAPAAR